MNKTYMILLISILLCHAFTAHAQTANQPLPTWVAMIDNPSINYFEAVKTFEAYWKDKIKPTEEEEREGEGEGEIERERMEKYLSSMSVSERNYWDQLQYHYKRFIRWQQDMLPFVQSDGRILSEQERIAIWEKQQEETKNLKR
jgi:hypothetical protein